MMFEYLSVVPYKIPSIWHLTNARLNVCIVPPNWNLAIKVVELILHISHTVFDVCDTNSLGYDLPGKQKKCHLNLMRNKSCSEILI